MICYTKPLLRCCLSPPRNAPNSKRPSFFGSLWVKGLFDGRHYFDLEPLGPTRYKLIHGEHFTGILSGLLLKQIGEETRRNFVAMNQALKMRGEANMASR